ncbi:hypothetical protein RU86_GL000802 [Lactococcus piscium]|uniref:Peptidase S54 rhomboid domain-containing protein n=1 Tax=Pseudolactococcus piscium TaxID=1364 RepID=A0A2A5RW35_9LACT|nr:rhomboid family intramembrane serine protease [Lactococcus piscium]PCS05423.1 hypothetical protein RU86_GL000802 [Lactococcus piscium]
MTSSTIRHFMTCVLLTMITLYLLNLLSNGQINSTLSLNSDKIINENQYFRLLTFAFLHGSLLHLVGNLLVINNIIYPFLDRKLSPNLFLATFCISTITTGIMLLVHYTKAPFTFVGASVGFYAFFGLMLIYYLRSGWSAFISDLSHQPIYNNLLVWAIFVFFLGNIITSVQEHFTTFSGLYAHTVSFMVGLIIGSLTPTHLMMNKPNTDT